ncbi:MAG TPA: Tm-1-like ATP-binding domain-containing protein, partial [Acetobacteraceae bacterium]|nr:Tm-1-like ATP-binding domain-containing protein [Acetobacteraceae bacterium]
MPRAYVCGTFDTKAPELGFIAACLRDAGVDTCTVDVSTRPHEVRCDVTAADVARHHPLGEAAVLGLHDRGVAITAMVMAFERFVAGRNDVAGMIGAGGSGGTALLAPAMRALPVGVPKLLVSTVASGNVAAYVGASDLWLVPSMTDVQGLNRISRRLLG